MKRVLFTIILFLSFCISVNALTGYAYCPDDEEPVNMRKGPSTSSDLIGSGITCNDTVEILNENPGSDWYQIKYKDLTGYASKKYIKLNKTVEEDGKVICIEDTSPLQMYSDLNRKNKINGGALSCGTKVKILDRNAGPDGKKICSTSLYKIKYGNLEGYVCGKYIEKDASSIDLNTDDLKKYREELSKIFPESYLDDLVKLHTLYPNWKFLPFSSNLDFNYILNKEYDGYYKGWSLIEDYYGNLDGLKSTDSWSYNYFTNVFNNSFSGGGSRWYAASKDTIAYYLDPRNFLNERNIFMFEELSYNETYHTREGVELMLKGTFMEGKYADSDNSKTYVDAFLDAALKYSISPYVLISRVIQEIGAGGSTIVSGTVSGYEGYYNFYNIGATASGGDKNQTIINGLEYAKREGWNSPYKAVVGGASFLGNNYVKVGQNTEYLQKWDLVGPEYVDHQYMQNIQAPYSQSYKTYSGYSKINMLNSAFVFYIPVFNNMPKETKFPSTGNPNNYLASLVINKTSLFSSPSNEKDFNIEVESDVSSVEVSATTVVSAASISGLGTVALNSENTKIELVVTAENGKTRTYTINVKKKEAPIPEPEPTPDPEPEKVLVSDVLNKAGIKVNDNYLYGFEVGSDISSVLDKLKNTGLDIMITSSKDKGLIASGDKIKIKTNIEEKEYVVIIYGDVNGDGKISSADYIKIKNYIMDVKNLSDDEKVFADANRDGKVSSADYIAIKNHIMEVKKINQ